MISFRHRLKKIQIRLERKLLHCMGCLMRNKLDILFGRCRFQNMNNTIFAIGGDFLFPCRPVRRLVYNKFKLILFALLL